MVRAGPIPLLAPVIRMRGVDMAVVVDWSCESSRRRQAVVRRKTTAVIIDR